VAFSVAGLEDLEMTPEFWNGKRVLITGHTGFKGSWLAFWLERLGAEVHGFALDPDTDPNLFTQLNIADRITSVTGDVRDLGAVRRFFVEARPDAVFHMAAQSLVRRSYRLPVESFETNVMGTVHVLEGLREVEARAAVIVTTDKVYENDELGRAYVEDDMLGGYDPYASSKACAEIATAAYRRSFFADGGTRSATARAGNVIGGGDWSEDRLLPDMFRSLVFGEPLTIRNPDAVRPWQHVLEPLGGYLTLAEKLFESGDAAEAWNFGPASDEAKPVSWIVDRVLQTWGNAPEITMANGEQLHESRLLSLDSSKATARLGWRPKIALPEAIELTTEWYRSFKDGRDPAETTSRQIDTYTGKDAIATA
jgi:CDP-glucose 4,6-dehydratase